MLQSHSMFESLSEMVSKACDPVRPTLVKSLAKNREKLDQSYQEMYHDFKVFKEEVNDPKFNDKDENGANIYERNDSWFKLSRKSILILLKSLMRS